jgi:hypothetical protein
MKFANNRLEIAAAILFVAAAIVMWTVSVVAGLPIFCIALGCTAQARLRSGRSSAGRSQDVA